MAQTATRRSSAVRKEHAEHPSYPTPASKPGTPASAEPGGRRRRDHGRTSAGGEAGAGGSRKGPGRRARGGEAGAAPGGERSLGTRLAEKMPSASGGLSLPKPHLPKPHYSIWARLAGKVLKKIAKHELRRLTKGRSWSLEALGGGDLEQLRDKLGGGEGGIAALKPRLPIQESIDVAVPVHFAWSQWMELGSLPEGVDRVVEIERDGDQLSGRRAGVSEQPWSAEVLDERDCESFAWKSGEGSDCAGLVTFHSLGERLTRLELTLDVLPQDATESALLLTGLAQRRARRELRRFKADLELVSPDVYADGERSSSQ